MATFAVCPRSVREASWEAWEARLMHEEDHPVPPSADSPESAGEVVRIRYDIKEEAKDATPSPLPMKDAILHLFLHLWVGPPGCHESAWPRRVYT